MKITGLGYDFESALSNALDQAESECRNKYYEYYFKWNIQDLKGSKEAKLNQETGKLKSDSDVEIEIEIEDLLHN